MKITYPDYNKSILNLSNSILKYYGVEHNHSSLEVLDDVLNKHYKNVVVMIFDAMGSKNLESILPEDSFLRSHMLEEITSVFPPTTTAATTTLESGLAPMEHAWLGWSLHFDEVKDNVNIFINTNDIGQSVADYHVATRYIPYNNIVDKINETGKTKAYSVSPFGTYKIETFEELIAGVETLCNNEDRNYLYTYWPEPDSSMHVKGVNSKDVIQWMNKINDTITMLSENLKDTLLIVTADHGHIDGINELLDNYKELESTLKWLPSIEPRALACYVKEGMKESFKEEFIRNFGQDFMLLSKQEVIDSKLFGDGIEHPRFKEFIGDYLAVATGTKSIFNTKEEYEKFIGVHAGLTEVEMMVPLIIVECQ